MNGANPITGLAIAGIALARMYYENEHEKEAERCRKIRCNTYKGSLRCGMNILIRWQNTYKNHAIGLEESIKQSLYDYRRYGS